MGEESHLLDFGCGEQKVIEWIVMDLLAYESLKAIDVGAFDGQKIIPRGIDGHFQQSGRIRHRFQSLAMFDFDFP